VSGDEQTLPDPKGQPALKDLSQDSERQKEELQAELNRVFDYHKPEGHIVSLHEAWRIQTKQFATLLMGLPPTRERAMALTRLEECAFWIHACIARNHDKFSEDPLEVDTPDQEHDETEDETSPS